MRLVKQGKPMRASIQVNWESLRLVKQGTSKVLVEQGKLRTNACFNPASHSKEKCSSRKKKRQKCCREKKNATRVPMRASIQPPSLRQSARSSFIFFSSLQRPLSSICTFCTSKASKLSASACSLSTASAVSEQHTLAYASIRQHTSAYVSIRQHTSGGERRPSPISLFVRETEKKKERERPKTKNGEAPFLFLYYYSKASKLSTSASGVLAC